MSEITSSTGPQPPQRVGKPSIHQGRTECGNFVNSPDEIIEDDPEDNHAREPDTDPNGPKAPLPESVSFPQVSGAGDLLGTFAE
jgi:hypothetical protein